MAKCGPPNPGLSSSSQVALRVRPISVAELEEGATLIAHKVDEQVLGAATRSCRVKACSDCLAHLAGQQELCVSLHLWVGYPQHRQAFFFQEGFLNQLKESLECLEPGWAQTIKYILMHVV